MTEGRVGRLSFAALLCVAFLGLQVAAPGHAHEAGGSTAPCAVCHGADTPVLDAPSAPNPAADLPTLHAEPLAAAPADGRLTASSPYAPRAPPA